MQKLACAVLSVLLLMQGCTDPDSDKPMAPEVAGLPDPDSVAVPDDIAAHLSGVAFAQLSKAIEAAQAMQSSIGALSRQANSALLEEARVHWRSAYSAYLGSLAAVNIPVREPAEWFSAALTRRHLEQKINSWPIEPGYIDYLEGYPTTGIVNDTTLTIDHDNLISQHQFSDRSYVSLGFHALEFLLWGERGHRQVSDFDTNVESSANSQSEPPNPSAVRHQARRLAYLTTASDILISDLQRLQMRWAPATDNQAAGHYAQLLSEVAPAETLQASLLTVARLIEQDLLQHYLQDEGSSPFSATTPDDLAAALRGIRQTLLSEDGLTALQPVLTARKDEADLALLATLISLTGKDTACSVGWSTTPVYTEGQSACREQMLELLITLKKISDQLGLQVPVSS
ncbi:MAG: imelysin family protein [Pseudomonadota bacterium]|nr:imelysin family protein [Pseudomonadota bacterium]